MIRKLTLEAKANGDALAGKRPTGYFIDDVIPFQPRMAGKSSGRGTLMGMDVHVSPLCVSQVPVREHKAKGTTAYSKRIQKKWNKRFGFKQVQDVYIVNGGRSVFMHPEAFAKLRIELDQGMKHL